MTHKWEGYHNCIKLPLKSEWSEPQYGGPAQGGGEHLALKSCGAYVWESQWAVEKPVQRQLLEKHLGHMWRSLLTNFRACAGVIKISWNCLQNQKCWWVPFPPLFWSDAGRHHFWHSRFTLLIAFTPPWHFPKDPPRLRCLQSSCCPATQANTQQCVCITRSQVSQIATFKACSVHQCRHNNYSQASQPAKPGTSLAC